MKDGKIIEEGPPAQLHADPKTFFGMNFMGRCNTFEGTLAALDGDTAVVETAIGELRTSRLMDDSATGDRVFACFRPKFCELLTDDASPSDPSSVVIDGVLAMRAATRDFTEYEVEVEDSIVLVRTPEPIRIETGDDVRFAIPREDVRIFGYDEHEALLDSDVVSAGEDEAPDVAGDGIDASKDSTAVADAVE
jgi:ABC-type Fe3+/spermidine/putrescine transport system ATPase subunit